MKKRGRPRRIGQRLAVILLLLFQLLFAVYALVSGSLYSVSIRAALRVMSFAVAVFVIAGQDKSAYKLTWTTLILLFPAFGGLFYLLYRLQSAAVRMRRRLAAAKVRSQQYLTNTHSGNLQACSQFPAYCTLISYLERNAGYPIYGGCRALYLSPGEKKLEKLLEELSKAEKYIFLEYFIVEPGQMWDSIFEILKNKARAGVDVRLIYDDFGCFFLLPKRFSKQMAEAGIRCCVFNPFLPVFSSLQNNRDHRKIVAIDGRVAFTGGINIADEYINALEKHGHWKDAAVFVSGRAALSFAMMFLEMWSALTGTQENLADFCPAADEQSSECGLACGFVQPYAASPLDGEYIAAGVYLRLLYAAHRYIYICTPYLILDEPMLGAMVAAAKGGVDIRILTPCIGDKWYVHMTTRSYYRELLAAGVRIYEYSRGFVHAKTFVSDDSVAAVGSANLDFRSLYLHFESGACFYGGSVVNAVRDDFLHTISCSREMTVKDCRGSFGKRLIQDFLRVFAPLM